MDEALEYFIRFIDGKLTDDEMEELEQLDLKNKDKKYTSNPYAACGMYEDELQLSLDTH